ncbi:hypothetical protein [uncultured Selenomonas sp.]|uniref:hypothetical protein n=1 Tax=uncultured Selenomonas sp. TaxID=159275 RepID=UPI0025D6A150|nr:hypothetical protein [uncultured Selenomonas sp.]
MEASTRNHTVGFDGHRFFYQAGAERQALLDTQSLPQPLVTRLLAHLQSLGNSPEAMGVSLGLILSLADALTRDHAPCVLCLGMGGRALSVHLAALLRQPFPGHDLQLVLLSDGPSPAPEVSCVPGCPVDLSTFPAPVVGYDACLLLDDGIYDASAYTRALTALRPGGHVFCLTARQSILSAAQAAARGTVYPITDHLVCFAGKASKLRSKATKHAGVQVILPPLSPAPTRTMVFLPYKAAMWDCLESIWRAAAADPSTRAYVVPIPFAEKNPDGTVRDWQYEGGRLPKGVPVVDWREIDLAALHPDAVFIHNPFDDCNNVTTVDARYYTTELKKITRKLIYVPYYATGGWIYPELVTPPGYQTADHVIVENDADRAKFEQFYPAPPVPPGKFWALGSPKFDKVRTDRREDYPLPEAWAQLLAGKKAVLYNTTLVAALQNTVHFLPKLQWVLEQFRAAGDIVLWWRPHPLLLPTLHSMRPELAAVYEQLVADYRAQGWFIYDDTPDLHRAIAWTDAYYGDYGSMIWLMQAAGKPALAQNYGIHDGF